MKPVKDKYAIQAVDHALDVLEQFSGLKAELGISEISRNLDLHKNNVFRLLATLKARGYVEQSKANDSYRLGIRALELGKAFLSHTGLIRVAAEEIHRLSAEVRETVYLGIMRENQVFYIEDAESDQPLRVASRIGTRLSPLCTAIGKVFLAFYDEETSNKVIANNQFIAHTKKTITDPDIFRAQLPQVRERGYAVDDEEKDEGVKCIAAPVFNYDNEIVAAISISGPVTRMVQEALDDFYRPRLLAACGEVSRMIGYTGEVYK
ncbi:MAG: IclR family transcriptional regulator [bacterium]|nr:IclR family transcriptional regulator [bacterium]